MSHDPYYCLSCQHKAAHEGIITILSECHRCGSLLIVPLACMHIMDMQSLSASLPSLIAEDVAYRKRQGKRHLKLVQSEEVANETKKENK